LAGTENKFGAGAAAYVTTGWAKKVSLVIIALTLSTVNQLP